MCFLLYIYKFYSLTQDSIYLQYSFFVKGKFVYGMHVLFLLLVSIFWMVFTVCIRNFTFIDCMHLLYSVFQNLRAVAIFLWRSLSCIRLLISET